MKINRLNFALALAIIIISALCGEEGTDNSLRMLQDRVFGEAYKAKPPRRQRYVSDILVSDREFVFTQYDTGQWISRIDFFYNLNHATPFSQLGEMIIRYMPAVKAAFYDPLNKTNFGDYIRNFLWNLKPVLRNVSPIAIEKNGERFLAYRYDWQTMSDFAKAVGNLYGSEIIITQFSESLKLKNSFKVLTEIYNYLNRNLKANWNESYIEATSFKLPKNSIEPEEVVQTLKALLEVSNNYAKFPKLAKANFYGYFVDSCTHLADLIFQSQDVDYVKNAVSYVSAFGDLFIKTTTSFTSAQHDLESVVMPADSRHNFDDQAKSLLALVEQRLEQAQLSKSQLQRLSESLKGVIAGLSNMVSRPLDNTYQDVTFLSLDSKSQLARQDITVTTWETLKKINSELSQTSSPLMLNSHSGIAKKLIKLFRSALKVIVNYEQLSKLRVSYFKLYEIAKKVFAKSSIRTLPNAKMEEVKYYQLPRIELFQLFDHLSSFQGLLTEIAQVNKRDYDTQEHFLNALQYIQDIVGDIGNSVKIAKDYCFESFDSEEYPEISDKDVISTHNLVSGNSPDSKVSFSHNHLPSVEPLSNSQSFKTLPSVNPTGEIDQELSGELSKPSLNPQHEDQINQNKVIGSPEEFISKNDEIIDQLDPNLDSSYDPLSNSLSIYDQNSQESQTTTFLEDRMRQRLRSRIKKRRIVLIEYINCSKCQNDQTLAGFVSKLSLKM